MRASPRLWRTEWFSPCAGPAENLLREMGRYKVEVLCVASCFRCAAAAIMLDPSELARYLAKIDRTFGIDGILNLSANQDAVVRYYEDSEAGYRLFHNSHGSVHMTLSDPGDPRSAADDLGQARIVEQHAQELAATAIAELGAGKGFNVAYLAGRRPESQVFGLDLTPLHVAIARKNYARVSNLHFVVGDFNSLPFAKESCDLLFEVEALCHAHNAAVAFSEAFRVLRPGGRFVLFDGFRADDLRSYSTDIQTAVVLVERSMAVEQFPTFGQWISMAECVGFRARNSHDLSAAILPNLERFQFLARGFYKFPQLAARLTQMCSSTLLKNSVAGLLMPFTIQAGAHGYCEIVLDKPV